MAEGVRVVVSDELIISALNLPGRPVSNWRDRTGELILQEAFLQSPTNDPANAMHRVVPERGDFKKSWYWDRYGNQHRVGARIGNVSAHAWYVEEGRRGSGKFQRFSWTNWGGEIRSVGAGTSAPWGTKPRLGKHILRDATNKVMPSRCAGYSPLV